MKVLQLLNLLPDYQLVSITPDCDLDWNQDNPYILEPEKACNLTWFLVRKTGEREVTSVSTTVKTHDSVDVPYISISYK